MPLVVRDRVRETTTTTGTGTVTLAGAVTGFQSFSVIGNGNTTYYTITDGTNWEVGVGTYTSSGTTLSRDTVLESSNAGSLVNFPAGTKDVFVTYPAEEAVYQDGSSINAGTAVLGVTNGGTGAATLTSGYVLKGNGTSAVSASIIYDNGTNVGIGTSSPGYKLDVSGVIKSSGDGANFLLLEKSSNTGVYARWKRPDQEYYLALDINNNGGRDFSLYDGTAAATRLTVDSSGNVGIGTNSPGSPLDVVTTVSGANGITVRGRSSDEVSNISFKTNNAATTYAQIQGRSTELRLQTNSTLPVTIYTNSTEYFRIGPAGQIGLTGANYGTSGQVLTSNGSGSAPTWQSATSAGSLLRVTVFTASGTWTKGSGTTKVKAYGVGGGGGTYVAYSNSAPNGGSGAFCSEVIDVTGVSTVSVTVGSGGSGSTSGSGATAGGSSSFGSYWTAGGGARGAAGSSGAGGTATGGDININGSNGYVPYGVGEPVQSHVPSPLGGYPAYGSSPRGIAITAAQGNGIAGVVIVEEYA